MTRRDPIVALVHDFLEEPAVDDVAIADDAARLADRILALIFPETPDPEMVEIGARAMCVATDGGNVDLIFRETVHSGDCTQCPWTCAVCQQNDCRDIFRAALAAERKWWSE